jgi:hypothetical protein
MRKLSLHLILGVSGLLGTAIPSATTAVGIDEFLEWVQANQEAQFQFLDGTTVHFEDCDALKPFVPPGWMRAGFCFEGMEYRIKDPGDISPPQAYKDATEKFAGQPAIDENGAIQNYTAGRPFDPATFTPGTREDGFKAIWNYNFRWQHDGLRIEEVEWVWVERGGTHDDHEIMKRWTGQYYGGGGKFSRILYGPYQRVMFSYLAHRPETNYRIPGRWADNTEFREYTGFTDPFDIAGTAFLILRYTDPYKADDSWAYIPSLRRVRRISVEVKSDSLLGTEDTLEDFYGFAGRIMEWDWQYVGKIRMLAIARSRDLNTHFGGPDGWQEIDDYGLMEMDVVRGTPHRKENPYSAKIVMMSRINTIPYYSEAYDRAGELWKVWKIPKVWTEDPWFKAKDKAGAKDTPEGTRMSAFQGIQVVNLQNWRATIIPCRGLSYPRVELEKIKQSHDLNKLTEGR